MNGFNGFGKAKKDVADGMNRGLEAVGIFVKGEYIVRLGAHVRSGNLIGSPAHKVEGTAVRVGTNVDYAGFLEYGTSRSRAFPCLRPAIDENIDKIKALFKEAIGEKL